MKVALIPARGGSKRIPRKNVRLFHGKPIIAYSIETAIHSGLFDEVIVSTDDEEIASIAEKYGACVPFMRPANLADDHATTVEVIKHALRWYEEKNQTVSAICCIYATAPFLSAQFLAAGYEAIANEAFQYAFAATRFDFPIQRAIEINDRGAVKMFQPEHLATRSQDLTPAYHDVGQFYWGTPQAFIKDLPLFSEHARAIVLPSHLCQDIDTMEDWFFAEMLYERSQAQS